jgi:hypothetical protein
VPDASLSDTVITDILSFLHDNGSSLTDQGLIAASALVETLEAGLRGNLDREYVLASMDPGMGKTLTVSRFLKAWSDRGFDPSSSVLMAFARIEQIVEFIQSSGLATSDIAVLTGDKKANALGVPEGDHGSARVMFTTHEMIRRRTRMRSFADAADFHFQDQPRTLRVWDESLVLAEGIALRLDDIDGLASKFRQVSPKFIAAVEEFQTTLRIAPVNTLVDVPEELADLIPWHNGAARSHRPVSKLAALSGGLALLVDGGSQGKALVGVGPSLPSDFAPVVILDASGRVRPTYEVWEKHRGNLRRLPEAKNDYRRLYLHLWERASGKATLARPQDRAEVVNAIAEVINKDDTSEWLIVHFKERDDILRELKLAVNHDAERRVVPLTWGRHDATNAFAHISNVVVIGQLTYGDMNVHALACAAAGLPTTVKDQIDPGDFQWGEFQHHLLQALSRASVRKSRSGLAGPCRALVVSTPSPQTRRRVQATFPGCELIDWRPVEKPLAAHVAAAADYLRERFADPAVLKVSKADVRQHLGMEPGNFARDLIDNEQFDEFLQRQHIWVTRQWFERQRFEPWPDGGWVYEEDAFDLS